MSKVKVRRLKETPDIIETMDFTVAKFTGKVEDGKKIYFDGVVYFTVDEDGMINYY